MIQIVVGTNRKGSTSGHLAKWIHSEFEQANQNAEILDLATLPFESFQPETYGGSVSGAMGAAIQKINESEGLYFIVPEYNGGFPGALKFFIDHWSYPDSFEFRPVSYLGIGGMFGGLRPIEHLQQIMGYRNAFQYPERIFIQNIWDVWKESKLNNEMTTQLIQNQIKGFVKFVSALKESKIHCLTRPSNS